MNLWETKILALKKKLTTNSTKNPTIWRNVQNLVRNRALETQTKCYAIRASLTKSSQQSSVHEYPSSNSLHWNSEFSLSTGLGLPQMSVWPHCREVTLHVTSRARDIMTPEPQVVTSVMSVLDLNLTLGVQCCLTSDIIILNLSPWCHSRMDAHHPSPAASSAANQRRRPS